ncbi:MAG: hypothetical protein P4L39_03745 [Humidesulfovibrio sp.]|nr:hypothetical protein [Humidesulfovibrio sp.]
MLLVGTPSHSGTVSFEYLRACVQMLELCREAGVGVGFHHLAYESLVPRARNFIANEFLRQEIYSHLLFIDADLGFPPDAALRYMRSGKDVVCGIYPAKHLDTARLREMPDELTCAEAVAASLAYTVQHREGSVVQAGFVPVEYAPAGFMMIRRQVLARMAEAYPQLRYKRSFVNSGSERHDNWAFFDTQIDAETGDYLPEDYAFCKRWTALGGEVCADVQSCFVHMGNCDYAGDYKTYLQYHQAARGKA